MNEQGSFMKLEIKNIDCIDFDLCNLTYEQSEFFQTIVTISIGFVGEIGSDDFSVHVYTVKWLDKNLFTPMLCKHSIIVKKMDFIELYNYVNCIIEECNSMSFTSKDMALRAVAKYFSWEFEDYHHF